VLLKVLHILLVGFHWEERSGFGGIADQDIHYSSHDCEVLIKLSADCLYIGSQLTLNVEGQEAVLEVASCSWGYSPYAHLYEMNSEEASWDIKNH
jgi:hypothetical protein